MVKKIIVAVLLLPILLWMFAPKKELLFLLEKRLAEQGIVLADGTLYEHPFGLTIEHPVLFFKGVRVASVDTVSVWSVLFYTRGRIDSLTIDPSLQTYFPEKIDAVSLVHTVVNPLKISVALTGSSLAAEGEIDLRKHAVRMMFPKLTNKNVLKRYLKQTKGGWIYEQQF